MSSMDVGGPSLVPPAESNGSDDAAPGSTAPTLTPEQMSTMMERSPATPTMAPPSLAAAAAAAAETAVTATWRSNVHVDGLWSIDETRNAWLHVTGLGWRKIYNARDGAFQALVALAGQARQTNRPVSLREEADGMIYEIYLW